MTQHTLIVEYVKEFGSIIPAKMSGKVYRPPGQTETYMFGNEAIRRAQELVDRKSVV